MNEIECEQTNKSKLTIKAGDIVRIRSREEIYNDYKRGLIDCGWNDYMYDLCGTTYIITPEIAERAENGIDDIFHVVMPQRVVGISLSMLELVQSKEDTMQTEISLYHEEQDSSIIQEMIKKVDIMRFKKLLSIASGSSKIRPTALDENIVNKYLLEWAKNKYDFYLLFDRNLSIEKQVEIDMDEQDMAVKIDDLARSYPQYANLLKGFNSVEFLNNESFGYNRILEEVYPEYKRGAKLSKVLGGLITDQNFKDSLANVLEDRKIRSNIAISIDPYDYLTMSVNKYGWESCQAIGPGEHAYATGGGAIMLDNTTLIAYRHSGKNEQYSMYNVKFAGNSKSWRQLIFVDKEHCSFIAAREYPSEKPALAKEVRLMLEHQIGEYTGLDNDWVATKNGDKTYIMGSEDMYHDVESGYMYRTVCMKGREKEVKVVVGRDVYCLSCGNPITSNYHKFVCC